MCYCERDAIKIAIHVQARRRYPGIKFHDDTLARVAEEFAFVDSTEVRALSGPELDAMSARLLRYLPDDACPPKYKASIA